MILDSDIIVALIVAAGSFAGNFLANRKRDALFGYRLEQVEKKVERLDVSKEIAQLREEVAELRARIEH